MRTFHTGGVAGGDITQGLPRVEELFEARRPKGLAIIAEFGGVVTIKDTKKKREIIVTDQETGNSKTYLIPYGSRIKVADGQVLEAGDVLTEGSINPHDLLKVKGVRAVQDYMIREVQRVYRLQVTSARAGYSSASLAIRLNTERPHLMVVISLSSVSR